jgi:hypothetical protein
MFHKHEVIEVGKDIDVLPPPTHHLLSHDLREYPRGCTYPEGKAVIYIITPLPFELNEGPGSKMHTHVKVPRHQVVGHRAVPLLHKIDEIPQPFKLENITS